MENIYKHYIIDMSSNNNFVQIPSMQGDGNNVRGFEIELISNSVPYPIDAKNTIVSIMGTKPDTKQICNECKISDEGYILVNITSQMSAVKGRGDYCIVLMDKNKNNQLKSFPFYILTTSAPFNISEIISSDEFQLLTKRITEVEGVVFDGNEIIQNLNDLEATLSTNETKRVQEESKRSKAEQTRVKAETTRTETFSSFMETANNEVERLRAENDTASKSAALVEQYANTSIEHSNLAKISEENAKKSEVGAKESETVSLTQAGIATTKASEASISEQNTKTYMNSTKDYMNAANSAKESAEQEASDALSSATASALSESNAKKAEINASAMADLAKSYAVGTGGVVRENDDNNNSKYYYELNKKLAQDGTGLLFMGNATFADLSNPDKQVKNYMFNMTEDFITDETFNCGAGIPYSAGVDVARTADGFWNPMVGAMVKSVNGQVGQVEIPAVIEVISDTEPIQNSGEYWILKY